MWSVPGREERICKNTRGKNKKNMFECYCYCYSRSLVTQIEREWSFDFMFCTPLKYLIVVLDRTLTPYLCHTKTDTSGSCVRIFKSGFMIPGWDQQGSHALHYRLENALVKTRLLISLASEELPKRLRTQAEKMNKRNVFIFKPFYWYCHALLTEINE